MPRKVKKNTNPNFLKHFLLGVLIFVIIQAIFMVGGLLLENSRGVLINGIPSAIGLTIILLIGLYFNYKGKEYVFYGNFILAFLAPLILFIILIFVPSRADMPTFYYTLGYMTLLIVIVYGYFVTRIVRENN